ncbi:MAG: helix-turn-helix domain-containing protein [Candidatus Nanopelagicales bacterium]
MPGPARDVVALLVGDTYAPFELGVVYEVFGVDRTGDGVPAFDFAVASVHERVHASYGGMDLVPEHGLDRLATADIIAIPALGLDRVPEVELELPSAVAEALQAAVARGARILTVCSGSYVAAAAGLLEGRRATTHWMYVEDFARRYPTIDVQPDVLYVEDGPILTSAGTAAGIDLCLHVVRQDYGSRVANAIARRMVVPPHRDGGQAQYVALPIPVCADDGLGPTLDWMLSHLHEEIGVDDMAAHALMSPRTFARRFREETGTTPYSWLITRRVEAASRLLEDTTMGVDEIATAVGFGSGTVLRHHFGRIRGTSPLAYRRTFCGLTDDSTDDAQSA